MIKTFRITGKHLNGMDCRYDWTIYGEHHVIHRKITVWTWGDPHHALVEIVRDTDDECYREIFGQVSDGMFENCRITDVEEVFELTDEECVRELDHMPYDKHCDGEWYYATGTEICIGNPNDPADWYNQYVDYDGKEFPTRG